MKIKEIFALIVSIIMIAFSIYLFFWYFGFWTSILLIAGTMYFTYCQSKLHPPKEKSK